MTTAMPRPAQTCTKMTKPRAMLGSPKNAEFAPTHDQTVAAGPAEGLNTSDQIRPIANEMWRVDRRPKTKEFNIGKNPFCNGLDGEEVGPTNVAGRTPAVQC